MKSIIGLCALILTLCGCEETHPRGELIVLTSADNPPFESFDTQNYGFKGYDVDLARALAKKLGKKLEIVEMPFSVLIPALKSGRGDMIFAALTPSDERAKNIDFSTPYFKNPVYLLAKKSLNYAPKTGVQGLRIGVQQGSTYESYYMELSSPELQFDLRGFSKIGEVIQELLNNRIDVAVMGSKAAETFAKNHPTLKIIPLPGATTTFAAGFRKGSPLKSDVDQALKELRKEGFFDSLEKKWLSSKV